MSCMNTRSFFWGMCPGVGWGHTYPTVLVCGGRPHASVTLVLSRLTAAVACVWYAPPGSSVTPHLLIACWPNRQEGSLHMLGRGGVGWRTGAQTQLALVWIFLREMFLHLLSALRTISRL